MRWLLCLMVFVQAAVDRGEGAPTLATEFPFEYWEGLLWIEVLVAPRREPLRFLLDSGAEVSVVNLETARRLGLPLGERVKVSSVHAAMAGYWLPKLSATASDVRLPDNYLGLDLSKLSGACERAVDGLIGADFFQGRIVQIDFGAGRIRLLNISDPASPKETTSLEILRDGLCVKASVNGGKPRRFRLDTGCATALQWVTSQAPFEIAASKLAIGLAQLNVPQTQTTVKLAGRTFVAVPTGLHRTAIFDGEAGLLGNGLLSRFETVTVDWPRRRLSFGRLRESP